MENAVYTTPPPSKERGFYSEKKRELTEHSDGVHLALHMQVAYPGRSSFSQHA